MLGHIQHGTLHLVQLVIRDIKMSCKAEVLRVVRQEHHIDAAFVVHHQGVLNVVVIEADSLAGRDRADEGVLQKAHIVLVDVHVGKDVLYQVCNHVTRREHRLETIISLSVYGGLCCLGVLSVVLFRNGLLHQDRDNQFTCLRANFGQQRVLGVLEVVA